MSHVKGEKQAFWEQLFAAHHATLKGFLRRRVPHTWDVQDLAQETYFRMLRIDDQRADEIADPRAYLFTVASNLVREHAVIQKRHAASADIDHVLATLEAPDDSPEEEMESQIRRAQLAKALNNLPPRCKAVLLMQHREGMTYKEIADRLGVSTHMVKKYVVRALKLCRDDIVGKE